MKYMLDTDICSYVIKENKKSVMDNLITHQSDDIYISAVTKAEMLYGAKKKNSDKIAIKIKDFFKIVTIVPFDTCSADVYADIKNKLEKNGVLSKPTISENFLEETARRTAAYSDVREDSSTGSTTKIPDIGRLRMNSDGTPIGNMDMLIASCAISINAVLVTNNVRHFSKIDNLQIQNWLEE